MLSKLDGNILTEFKNDFFKNDTMPSEVIVLKKFRTLAATKLLFVKEY